MRYILPAELGQTIPLLNGVASLTSEAVSLNNTAAQLTNDAATGRRAVASINRQGVNVSAYFECGLFHCFLPLMQLLCVLPLLLCQLLLVPADDLNLPRAACKPAVGGCVLTIDLALLQRITDLQNRFEHKTQVAWNPWRPIVFAVLFGLLMLFAIIAGCTVISGRFPRIAATFTWLLWLMTAIFMILGAGKQPTCCQPTWSLACRCLTSMAFLLFCMKVELALSAHTHAKKHFSC